MESGRSLVRGRLAQWLERCVDIAEVTGSSPVPPTILYNRQIYLHVKIVFIDNAFSLESAKHVTERREICPSKSQLST